MAALPSDLHSSAQTSAVPGTTSHDALELGEDSDSTLPELALPELDTSNAPSSPHSIGDGRGTGRVGVPPPLRSAGGSSSSSSSIETLKPEDGALTGTSSSSSSIETLKPPRSAGGASSSSSIETLKPEDTGMSSSSSSSIKTLVPEDTLTRTSSSSSSSSSSMETLTPEDDALPEDTLMGTSSSSSSSSMETLVPPEETGTSSSSSSSSMETLTAPPEDDTTLTGTSSSSLSSSSAMAMRTAPAGASSSSLSSSSMTATRVNELLEASPSISRNLSRDWIKSLRMAAFCGSAWTTASKSSMARAYLPRRCRVMPRLARAFVKPASSARAAEQSSSAPSMRSSLMQAMARFAKTTADGRNAADREYASYAAAVSPARYASLPLACSRFARKSRSAGDRPDTPKVSRRSSSSATLTAVRLAASSSVRRRAAATASTCSRSTSSNFSHSLSTSNFSQDRKSYPESLGAASAASAAASAAAARCGFGAFFSTGLAVLRGGGTAACACESVTCVRRRPSTFLVSACHACSDCSAPAVSADDGIVAMALSLACCFCGSSERMRCSVCASRCGKWPCSWLRSAWSTARSSSSFSQRSTNA
mmetsp:Transcript_30225/g.101907  ORF Transcript_30225/g.101907 Transcript_30225/m.101907 type:complete len:594 (-) Transcript_30225:132-1913(-)